MSVEARSKTIGSYLDALVARGDFADYFTDDVSWTWSAAARNGTAEGLYGTSSSG